MIVLSYPMHQPVRMNSAPFAGRPLLKPASVLLLLAFWAIFAVCPASARLATLGEITKVGLWDDNPLHVAILMDESGQDLISDDGGVTWKKLETDLSPENLRSLPLEGQVQYRFTLGWHTLIFSNDGGQNWTEISPWEFLRGLSRERIENQKSNYLAKYGHWLRHDDNWPLVFFISTGSLLFAGGWILWRQKQGVLFPLFFSGVCAYTSGFACFAVNAIIRWQFEAEQWETMQVWSTWIYAPRWPLGLLMHLTGNVWLAPMAAIGCLSVSPLTFALAIALPNWRKTLHVCGLAVAIGVVLLAAGVIFYGRESAL